MTETKIDPAECGHEKLTKILDDLYQCEGCKSAILIINATLVTREFASVMLAATLQGEEQKEILRMIQGEEQEAGQGNQEAAQEAEETIDG